jgi:chemotaxis protein methyltransferase CheR
MPSSASLVERLAALIQQRTGNQVPAGRLGFLSEVAERRAHAVGARTPTDYLHALAAGELGGEWGHLVSLVTIKESYFFRAPQQFEVIERQVLPRLVRARAASRRLTAWSAACARGEEAATLAMVFAAHPGLAGWDWTILATDIDEEALAGARRGLYGERAVALVPPPAAARYLTRRGKLFELVPEILARIDYRAQNLARPPYALPAAEFDLILLRNVLIYFDRQLQAQVVAEIAPRLARKGALFLGASETLWQIQDELEAVDLGTCYAYRHRRGRAAAADPGDPRDTGAMPTLAAPATLPAVSATPAVSAPPAASAPSAASAEHPPRPERPVQPAVLRRRGQTPAAMPTVPAVATAAGSPAPAARSAPELLLAAARDLAGDQLERARQRVAEALAVDPSEPACHALDGFLRDLGGAAEEAVAAYRAALYLDPSLFQIRLLLADSLLRLGRRDRAEHQYREVLTALESGRARALAIFDDLPLPDRERALRRCRQALQTS